MTCDVPDCTVWTIYHTTSCMSITSNWRINCTVVSNEIAWNIPDNTFVINRSAWYIIKIVRTCSGNIVINKVSCDISDFACGTVKNCTAINRTINTYCIAFGIVTDEITRDFAYSTCVINSRTSWVWAVSCYTLINIVPDEIGININTSIIESVQNSRAISRVMLTVENYPVDVAIC